MADDRKPPAEESLFAAMAEAEEQARAAREQRLAVEASLTQLRQAIQRVEAATAKLASAEPLLKAGMEQAAKAAFAKQSQDLVYAVERQVQNSINRMDSAVNRATHRMLPWTWILAAFLLGVVSMGVYGYFEIKEPLENTWHAQSVLYEEMKKDEAEHTPVSPDHSERHKEAKPASQQAAPSQQP
jgi:hypothetical protein